MPLSLQILKLTVKTFHACKALARPSTVRLLALIRNHRGMSSRFDEYQYLVTKLSSGAGDTKMNTPPLDWNFNPAFSPYKTCPVRIVSSLNMSSGRHNSKTATAMTFSPNMSLTDTSLDFSTTWKMFRLVNWVVLYKVLIRGLLWSWITSM